MAITPDGRHAYVTNSGLDTEVGSVSVIDTGRAAVTSTIVLKDVPNSVAITPDGRSAYISNIATDSVSVIDISTG